MRITAKHLREYERLPKWYGIAWRDVPTATYTCYIYPFNLVAAAARNIWLRIRYVTLRDRLADAYQLGFTDGARDGNRSELVKLLREEGMSPFNSELVKLLREEGMSPFNVAPHSKKS